MSKKLAFLICVLFVFFGCSDSNSKNSAPPPDNGGDTPPIPEKPPAELPVEQLSGKIFFTTTSFNEPDELYCIEFPDLEPKKIPIELYDWSYMDISPVGGIILLQQQNATRDYIIDTVFCDYTGKVLYRTDVYGEEYFWTRDGKYVYFGDYNFGIYEINTETWTRINLLKPKSSTYDHSVVLTPDGKTLVWSHHEWGHNLTCYRVPFNHRPFTYANADIILESRTRVFDEMQQPFFIDDDNYVIAVSDVDGYYAVPPNRSPWHISNTYVVNTLTNSVLATDQVLRLDRFFYSHDLSKIAYTRSVLEFSVVDALTKEPISVREDLKNCYSFNVAWSLCDQFICYECDNCEDNYVDWRWLMIYSFKYRHGWDVCRFPGFYIGWIRWVQ